MKIKNMFDRYISDKGLMYFALALVVLQPVLDLDYLIHPFLNQFGIPRISTIIKFIVLPLCVIMVYLKLEKNKKKIGLISILYGLVLALYFGLHCANAIALFERMSLTSNFYFSIFSELTYFLTLVLPLVYVYVSYSLEITEKLFEKCILLLSLLTAVPIFVANLFSFGLSTYSGNTVDNIFSWFNGIYEVYHPRQLAAKFFFAEGNTIGILMFALLPILFWILYKASSKKTKIGTTILITIHSFAMMMLSTRVGTYGTILIPIVILGAYLFLIAIRKEKFKTIFVIVLLALPMMFTAIYPYSPAYANQQIDAENDEFVRGDNHILEDHREGLKKGEGLIPGSHEFNQFYIYYFEDNAFLISSTPKQYYLEWYNYEYDPKFWVDYIFNYNLEERINGRQFQKIFMDYKWSDLEMKDKMMGMGYSTYMNGSILLERDFAQQTYTFGYLGFGILMLPWLVCVVGLAVYILIHWKTMFNMKNFMIMMSIAAAIGNSYISGHTMDQFLTSMFIALLIGYMIHLCRVDFDVKR